MHACMEVSTDGRTMSQGQVGRYAGTSASNTVSPHVSPSQLYPHTVFSLLV